MTEPHLQVDLELPREVARGQLVIAQVKVANVGQERRTVSARLHPAEGDISFVVDDPAGRSRRLLGRHQVDSPLRTVELAPGEAVAAGVNLMATDAAAVFEQPGVYRVRALFHPSVREPQVSSPRRELMVRTSRREQDRVVSDLLDPTVVGPALAIGDVDPGTTEYTALREAAAVAAEEPAGAVAALVVAASDARRGGGVEELRRLLAGLDEETLGWLVTAALPPAAGEDDPLASAALAVLEAADSPQSARALRMIRGEPIPADDAGPV